MRSVMETLVGGVRTGSLVLRRCQRADRDAHAIAVDDEGVPDTLGPGHHKAGPGAFTPADRDDPVSLAFAGVMGGKFLTIDLEPDMGLGILHLNP